MSSRFLKAFWVALALGAVLAVPAPLFANSQKTERWTDPFWQTFVAGKIDELPNTAVRKFLDSAQRNNPFAITIQSDTMRLGPFAPEENNVFWIPTLEVPAARANWRFLTSTADLPKDVFGFTTFRKDGQDFVRFFLHPYSVREPYFGKLAKENGGFRFEYQGAATGSVRSLIAWKTSKPKPEGAPGSIDMPKAYNQYLWPKVSVTRADIQGSRMNPVKKMVRAWAVTRLAASIPAKVKKTLGFDFEGEWWVGVPRNTDAGTVVRQVLPVYLGQDGKHVEPGFSAFSPQRLNEISAGAADPLAAVREALVRPLVKIVSYLLMEEGMMGEYHSQNYNFVMNSENRPNGPILLHDADAFRTSIELRALLGKSTAGLRRIDAPFFFAKDTAMRLIGTGSGTKPEEGIDRLAWNFLTEYEYYGSIVHNLVFWCKELPTPFEGCNKADMRRMVEKTFEEELAPYVQHELSGLTIVEKPERQDLTLSKIFRERLRKAEETSPVLKARVHPDQQELLAKEFERLRTIGRGTLLKSGDAARDPSFVLNVSPDGSAFIAAVSKPKAGSPTSLTGMALLGENDDPAAVAFAREIKAQAGVVVPMDDLTSLPHLRDVGGGSNVSSSVRAFLASKSQALDEADRTASAADVSSGPPALPLPGNSASQCVASQLAPELKPGMKITRLVAGGAAVAAAGIGSAAWYVLSPPKQTAPHKRPRVPTPPHPGAFSSTSE